MRLSVPSPRRAAVAVVVAAALVGCGGSPSPSTEPSDRLAPAAAVRAAAETAGTQSSRFELTSATSLGGQSFEITGTGVVDPGAGTGSATLTLPGGIGTMEQRFIGDELYLSVPGQPGYYRLAITDLVGTPLESAADPTGSLDALEGVSDDVREVGEEDVRGTATTRYEGTLDVGAAADQPGALGDLAAAGIDPSVLEAVPFEAWVDDEGRLRRFQVVVDLPASDVTGGQPITSTTTVELFDFGVEVAVEPPPADQVQDGRPLLDALRGTVG